MDHQVCTFCQSSSPLLFRVKDLNRRLSEEVFSYYRCTSCGLIFLHPHPADLGKYYPADYYGNTHTLKDLEPEYAFNRYKVNIVHQFARTGRLLEVGPSRGTFAYLAKEGGFEVSVIERDEECCRFLGQAAGIKALQSTDPTAALRQQEQSYEVIALWQVIEHLDDPWDFVRVATSKLAPGGILVLATPNPEALQFKIFGRRWFHLDAPRHLQIIPAGLLTKLGASMGLREVLLTSADADIHRHNQASWHNSINNSFQTNYLFRRKLVYHFVHRQVDRLDHRVRSYEERGFRGSTYTLVLQKSA